ncbi:MAG: type VII secretion protein EssC [Oscillospiraceae bacterium]|jgi:S-DNA-T family DNA segregation ATPase FtsK/SpoIIIE|nr:type VII secretion protein EssC [Oscillospiraceae bacterium]
MKATLITPERIFSLSLPEKVTGKFKFQDIENKSPLFQFSILASNGKWRVNLTKKIKPMFNNSEVDYIELESGKILKFQVVDKKSNYFVYLFVESSLNGSDIFNRYIIPVNGIVYIGRNPDNHIVYEKGIVTSKHARLVIKNSEISIYDGEDSRPSANGVFVNSVKTTYQKLNLGDVIWILGLKIIVGLNFLAINNPEMKVRINILQKLQSQTYLITDEEFEFEEKKKFSVSPRFKKDIEQKTFKIDSPPSNQIGEEMPFLFVLGPSVTMGMASMTTALFAINNAMANGNIKAAIPSIVMSGSMLLGTVLWPTLSKTFDKKRKIRKENLRQSRYSDYLEKQRLNIKSEITSQENILKENFITVDECLSIIFNQNPKLWERSIQQNDFLSLRLGLGSVPLLADFQYSERAFTLIEDNLLENLYSICENQQNKTLTQVPLTISLFKDFISGLVGNVSDTVKFSKGLILQLISYYSYQEVKLVFLCNEELKEQFEFVKWIPHTWSDDKKFRFVAFNEEESNEISSYLTRVFETRSEINEREFEKVSPYYVIFTYKPNSLIKNILAENRNLYFSVINICEEVYNLPKETSMVVEIKENTGRFYNKNNTNGIQSPFTPDIYVDEVLDKVAIELANTELNISENIYALPKMLTFLEMFGVGKIEHLNPLIRWKENDPTKSLQASIGVDTNGSPFHLDLHEKFHGPHGLIAGTTGSGKSEFIITYILSLALNYHPNEVAFVLIDYKGGGMGEAFKNLPHTVGVISNLDGSAIKRSLVSIESEIKRRQSVFKKAGAEVGISNIDIYKYQQLYREKSVREPLPHLLVIADEFAEFKSQQKDFYEKIVSAARIGRSLGVHLVLATQKPTGVVDDQVRSNSKFKICLKVQDREDSIEMLRRPDAANIVETGRFYLQVGFNELFELGQSAWAGAPYYPSDEIVVEKDNAVAVISTNARTVAKAKPKTQNTISNPKKQVDAIVEYLGKVAKEENITTKLLWLDPIPSIILLEEIKVKYSAKSKKEFTLNPIIGVYDSPATQNQDIIRVPLSESGNVLVYGSAGSGKTTFINAFVYSLITEHTADEINVYMLDFASETLRAFKKAPQIGDVVLVNESEKVTNLFKMLNGELHTRKRLFADFGGDYNSYISSGNTVPSIVVIINNYGALREIYEEREQDIALLSREGTKYGIYFVITVLGTSGISFRLTQNFMQVFVMQLNKEEDYVTVLGKTDGLYPEKFKGRGLVKTDSIYEFQVAHITEDSVPFNFIQNICNELSNNWTGKNADKIPVLPKQVDIEFLDYYKDKQNPLNVSIGVNKNSLKISYYPFYGAYITPIYSAGKECTQFAYDLSIFMKRSELDVCIIDINNLLADSDKSGLKYFSSKEKCFEVIDDWFNDVKERFTINKNALANNEITPKFPQKIYVLIGIADLVKVSETIYVNSEDKMYDANNNKLLLSLANGSDKFFQTVIIVDQIKNLNTISYSQWYTKHIGKTNGIWVGNGFASQNQFDVTKKNTDMRSELPKDFGFVVKNGKAETVKLLSSLPLEEDDDE